MIITGNQIEEEVNQGRIFISPYCDDQVSTNSYDLRLSNKLFKIKNEIIDPFKEMEYEEIEMDANGYLLKKGEFILGASMEEIGSNFYVPILHGKSRIARLGIFAHVTSDLIDIGYQGCLTFQIYSTQQVIIYPEMLFAQVSFWKPYGTITLYKGKYQFGKTAQVSKYHLSKL